MSCSNLSLVLRERWGIYNTLSSKMECLPSLRAFCGAWVMLAIDSIKRQSPGLEVEWPKFPCGLTAWAWRLLGDSCIWFAVLSFFVMPSKISKTRFLPPGVYDVPSEDKNSICSHYTVVWSLSCYSCGTWGACPYAFRKIPWRENDMFCQSENVHCGNLDTLLYAQSESSGRAKGIGEIWSASFCSWLSFW